MIELHVTYADGAEARRLARAVVEARHAACANIVENVSSIYRWEGAIEEETETLVIFKTSEARAAAAEAFIAENHPYDVPAIIRHTAVEVNDDYARWVEEETA
ncbi:MAG: divalent-cation tolerance protein CutA [Rhizobiaceae bacterium]|nr:divalent-cation tolerance protein CutA [Rhizobiaceae bacterium]MCV0405992.1 divalent-cation tolerance protein CutA [Rhizobiaceae bacterium]